MNDTKVLWATSEMLSGLLLKKGITTWDESVKYIAKLPYGRNTNRIDLSLVISEGKGTCSSKHAFLKALVDENKIPKVKLILGIYKMTQENTPGIGNHITKSGFSYIPEAHCYLEVKGARKDYTGPTSSIRKIENDILKEIEIAPSQVSDWKVNFHKQYIEDWRISEGISAGFDEIWEVREQCILSLSNSY